MGFKLTVKVVIPKRKKDEDVKLECTLQEAVMRPDTQKANRRHHCTQKGARWVRRIKVEIWRHNVTPNYKARN